MDTEALVLRESTRKDVYRCLSEFYYLPREGFKLLLVDLQQQLRTLNSAAVANAVKMEKALNGNVYLETLEIDFSRLFVGPYTLLAPPFGSVYLENERQIMGESTVNVLEQYRDAGLDMARNFANPPDHIAVELEFMSFLIFREAEAISNSDAKMVEDTLYRQKAFLENHLGRWVHEFTAKVETHAETIFYQHLAKVTRQFISEEMSEISTLMFGNGTTIDDCEYVAS